MERLKKLIRRIVELDNDISKMNMRRIVIYNNYISIINGNINSNENNYYEYLGRIIEQMKQERDKLVSSILDNYKVDQLYGLYVWLAKMPKFDFKTEELLVIFDLIDLKKMDNGRNKL